MRTPILAAAALLACTVAQADTWTFSYTGATSVDAPFELPSLDGRFSGQDLDGNGRIDRAELSELNFFHYQVAPSADMGAPMGEAFSSLDAFSFDLGSQALRFSATAGSWHDGYQKTDSTLVYTTGIGQFSFDLTSAQLTVHREGIAQAAAAPVPEPGTWGLMAAGLAALGVAARRRRAR